MQDVNNGTRIRLVLDLEGDHVAWAKFIAQYPCELVTLDARMAALGEIQALMEGFGIRVFDSASRERLSLDAE